MSYTELFLAGALFVIMIGMGLGLVVNDFKRVVLYPKAVAIGLALKVLVLPLAMFGILVLLPDYPVELGVGFVLLAACPGGATSNVIAGVARSDVALSITLTAMASLVTIITIPFFTNFALDYLGGAENVTVRLPVGITIAKIMGVTLLPVGIGMLIRGFQPRLADKAERPVRIVSVILLVVIVIGVILANKDHIGDFFKKAGPMAFALNFIALALAYGVAKLFRLPEKQAITISIETAIINGVLAMTIASTITEGELNENTYAFPAAVYSLVMYLSIAVLIWRGNRHHKKGAAE